MIDMEIKRAVVEMSIRFEARFGHLWVASNDIDDRENLREKLLQWTDEFQREKIEPQMIARITETVLSKSEFSNYPPTLNRFIFLCKEMNKMSNTGGEGKLYLELKKLDEKFSFIYSRLWIEQDKDKSRRRLEFWGSELREEGITPEIIRETSARIHKKGCYSQYPPSLNQFVLECLFCKIGDSFTDPDIAFIRACTNEIEVGLHPTIKKTRQIIGSHTLKLSKDKYIKGMFEKVYVDECRKYASNPESYDNFHTKDVNEVVDANVGTDDTKNNAIAQNNTEFFTSLLNKKSNP